MVGVNDTCWDAINK